MVLVMAATVWEEVDWRALVNQAASHLPTTAAQLLAAIAVLSVFFLAFLIARRLLRLYLREAGVSEPIGGLLVTLLKYTVAMLALVTAAAQLGIQVTSVVAGLGIAGLAVSFAAQDTIANIISGITLAIDKPFTVGDWVQLEGVHAHVTAIRLRTTTLTTLDNQTIVLPNKSIAQQRIVNYTLVPRLRVHVPVGIAYKEDTRAARRVMLAALSGDRDILPEPAPQVVVTGLGASSVNLEMLFWIEDSSLMLAKQWEYLEKCKHALDQAGIQIPYPHAQVFLEETEGLRHLTEAIGRA
jgi:small-conductance mechanosensitive channel